MESNVGSLTKMLQKNTVTTDGNCRARLKTINVDFSGDGSGEDVTLDFGLISQLAITIGPSVSGLKSSGAAGLIGPFAGPINVNGPCLLKDINDDSNLALVSTVSCEGNSWACDVEASSTRALDIDVKRKGRP